MELATFLPGKLALGLGGRAEYDELARFHYVAGRPATMAQVWVVRYEEEGGKVEARTGEGRVVAVAVVSYPTPRCRGREQYFSLAGLSYRQKILFANANVRTISRVVVHPQFRSLGLASILVRHACENSQTRYTEALAVMARAHPFFERGGMTKIEVRGGVEDGPWYFLHDKRPGQ